MREYQPTPEFEDQVRKAVSAPSANPEFVNHLRSELAGRPVKARPQFQLKLAWVLAFVLVLLALSGAAYALGRALGYFPGLGLVPQDAQFRVLSEPVSQTRDGITVTITQAISNADQMSVTLKVENVPAQKQSFQTQ